MRADPPGLVVFLDANILARPVTRSLLMFSSYTSDFTVQWSDFVEREADRRVRPGQATARSVRQRAGSEPAPPGAELARFPKTDPQDRQVLADAAQAGAARNPPLALFTGTESTGRRRVADFVPAHRRLADSVTPLLSNGGFCARTPPNGGFC
jgi:hypothetical protein